MSINRLLVATALSLSLAAVAATPAAALSLTALQASSSNNTLNNINNFVVIYLENRSFDNLFGTFPGANGIANASAAAKAQLPIATVGSTALSGVNPINNANLARTGSGTNASPFVTPADPNFNSSIANGPWAVDANLTAAAANSAGTRYDPAKDVTGDLVHRFYEEQVQINGGRMNQFIAGTHASPDAGGLVMSYYGQSVASQLKLWNYAGTYVLLDNFFHGAFGGSFLNHAWLVCACAFTTDANYNPANSTKLDPAGTGMPQLPAIGPNPLSSSSGVTSFDGAATTDGRYWVNTSRAVALRSATDTANGNLVQLQAQPHIGDRLNAAGLTWKWYSQWYKRANALSQAVIANSTLSNGTYSVNTAATLNDPAYSYPVVINGVSYTDPQYAAWGNGLTINTFNGYVTGGAPGANPAISNLANFTTALNFQWHHNPFAYFADTAPGTAAAAAHLQDRDDLLVDIKNNTLPNVVFYKPGALVNMHPGYANLTNADNEVDTIIKALQTTNSWRNNQMMIIVTFDEHGGLWDHVTPPTRDSWGPGTRIPTLVVAPTALLKNSGGYIDHTAYDTTSILSTIEQRWGLSPLTNADANATPLTGMLK